MAIDVDELEESSEIPPPDGEARRGEPGDGGDGDGGSGGRDQAGPAPEEVELPSPRFAAAVAFPTLAAAVMLGGIFNGASPRVVAALAGALGIGLGVLAGRIRRPFTAVVVVVAGIALIGPLMLFPDVTGMFDVRDRLDAARETAELFTPPVEFLDGWKLVVGWVMGGVGFLAAWVGVVMRWRALALVIPLPVAAFAGISVPDDQQVASGIVVLVLFAIGLGLLSSEQSVDDDEDRPSIGYELRKALKAVPLIGVLIAALLLGQNHLGFLFPDPIIDPAQEPQTPKVQPLSEANDRVLFEVFDTELTGPFRTGSLDVYDGRDWRLPPFADAQFVEVERSGVVDFDLTARVQASFTVRGLTGAVLPTLPNTVGVIARGPQLTYDTRNANIRLASGQVNPGFTYTVAAAGLPTIEELRQISFADLPAELGQFTEIPDPPPAVQDLIEQAPKTSKWDEFNFLRTWILDNVVAEGLGTPVSVTPERVDEMIVTEGPATPFEMVAAQAMLARWVGVPSRIGFGFDGGEMVDDKLQVRPRHGAAFPEVWFSGFKWLPVIGTPRRAQPSVGADPELQNRQAGILPSDELTVPLFVPTVLSPDSVLGQQLALALLYTLLGLLGAWILWSVWPGIRKARLRARRRDAALRAGVRARVALAYSEWRDYASDLGFHHPTETPLMFLDRFATDDEHIELAWLTTRVLWGDLRGEGDPEHAAVAEELSRSLRRRLASTQPASVRFVAAVSRQSMRDGYAPDVVELRRRRPRWTRRSNGNGDAPAANGHGRSTTAAPGAGRQHEEESHASTV